MRQRPGRRLLGHRLLELRRQQQSRPAHRDDTGQLRQPVGQALAFLAGAAGNVLGLHDGQRRLDCSQREGLSAERRAVVARPEGRRHFRPGPAGADRHAVAERLGHRHHVGLEPLGLEGEPVPGPSEAGLHLVEHEERVALGAERPHRGQVVRARDHDAALALERLQQDGRDRVGVERLVQRGDVVVGHVLETLGQRHEGRLLLGLAGGGERGQRAAVERVVGADHDMAAGTGPAPGQLERALVGLGARVAEEDLAAGLAGAAVDEPVDGAGDLGRQRVAVEVRDVAERPRLLGHRFGHGRMGVAERHHGQPGDEVEVFGVVGVVEHRALAPHEGGGRVGVGPHERRALRWGRRPRRRRRLMGPPSSRRPSR